jgi:miniconductance mechanosensitive channel
MQVYKDLIYNWLMEITGQEFFSKAITTLIVFCSIAVLAFLCFYLTRTVLITIIRRLSKRTKSIWDDILVESKFFHAVAHLIPASIFYFTANYAADYFPKLELFLLKGSKIYFLLAFILIINTLLKTLNEIYNETVTSAKERPIWGVLQFVRIIIYFFCGLVLVSIIFDKGLTALLTGLGAVAAILLLVFKDTILGFVASIQIGTNDIVKVGDFIEMPSRLANGTVSEINLTTVKVLNSDKTITNLPIYSLISESFINWKGLEQAGVRRIRRSLNIDINSIQFCDQSMIEKFQKLPHFNNFLKLLQQDTDDVINNPAVKEKLMSNGSELTNLGVFRKYLEYFLNNSPVVDKDLSIVIRHLQPTETGIPIEINLYCKEIRWPEFEEIQSAIFEHILAILPEFGLKVFQNLSGSDVIKAIQSKEVH